MTAQRRTRAWTPAEDARLMEPASGTGTFDAAAAELGRTLHACYMRASRLRREGRPPPQPPVPAAPESRGAAGPCGRGRRGRRGRAPVWTPEREARLLELVAERGGYERASAEFGIAVGTCRAKASLLRRATREAEARRAAAAGRCPGSPPPAPRARRPCLRCSRAFDREPGMFVCDACKGTEDWRLGSALAA